MNDGINKIDDDGADVRVDGGAEGVKEPAQSLESEGMGDVGIEGYDIGGDLDGIGCSDGRCEVLKFLR